MPRKKRVVAEEAPTPEGLGQENERYKWNQTTSDVFFQFKIPEGIKGKQLEVTMKPETLKIILKGQEAPLLDAVLWDKIKVDESYWEVENGKVTFSLCKYHRKEASTLETSQADSWWKGMIKGDPEMDMKYPPTVYYTTHSK